MTAAAGIDKIQHGGQGGAFAAAGGAGDHHQAAGQQGQVLEHRRQVHLVDIGHPLLQQTNGSTVAAFLAVNIHSVSGLIGGYKSEVQIIAVLKLQFLLVVGQFVNEPPNRRIVAVTAIGGKLAIDPEHGGQAFG